VRPSPWPLLGPQLRLRQAQRQEQAQEQRQGQGQWHRQGQARPPWLLRSHLPSPRILPQPSKPQDRQYAGVPLSSAALLLIHQG